MWIPFLTPAVNLVAETLGWKGSEHAHEKKTKVRAVPVVVCCTGACTPLRTPKIRPNERVAFVSCPVYALQGAQSLAK